MARASHRGNTASNRNQPQSASLADLLRNSAEREMTDLLNTFAFEPERAEITLNGRRMVLTDNLGLGIMRRELVSALGYERARGMMSRMGYGIGAADAQLAMELRKEDTPFEMFTFGPQLHALKGSVRVEPLVFEADPKSGSFYSEYIWHNSAECHAHAQEMGIGPYPGGWQQVGYASGFASGFFGRPMIFREIQCVAMGHERCFLVGKPAEQWEDAQSELKWFRAESYSSRPVEISTKGNKEVAKDLQIGSRSIVGASPGFNIVLHLVDKVAQTDAPVLFLGESGVGKEVFAHELHKRSRRADKPMIAVNCAAIPETLIEAELFGVEKGAYTGAHAARPGRFERANGGTLFLDEIGTLSYSAQGKLLRVLQESEYERVGGTKMLKADIRLIAATNANLRMEAEKGTFRADLFHRLNTFPIRIPPLRERKADIPLLANYFLRIHSAKHNKNNLGFDQMVIRYLHDYEWPGNIREMENTIERGVILANDGELIGVHHLTMSADALPQDQDIGSSADPLWRFIISQVRKSSTEDLGAKMLDSGLTHEEVMDKMLAAALERSAGNISKAAKMIGLTRSQISYWLKRKNGTDGT